MLGGQEGKGEGGSVVGEWELELEWESKWAGRRGTDVVVVALYLTAVATLPDVTLALQMREVGVEPNRPLTYRGSTYFGTNPSPPCLSLHSSVCLPPSFSHRERVRSAPAPLKDQPFYWPILRCL